MSGGRIALLVLVIVVGVGLLTLGLCAVLLQGNH